MRISESRSREGSAVANTSKRLIAETLEKPPVGLRPSSRIMSSHPAPSSLRSSEGVVGIQRVALVRSSDCSRAMLPMSIAPTPTVRLTVFSCTEGCSDTEELERPVRGRSEFAVPGRASCFLWLPKMLRLLFRLGRDLGIVDIDCWVDSSGIVWCDRFCRTGSSRSSLNTKYNELASCPMPRSAAVRFAKSVLGSSSEGLDSASMTGTVIE